MNFDQLKSFIEKSMRMSHIYQPVMLMTLLSHGGKASVRDIATSILVHDESQIDYYEQITKEMVGRVLHNRQVVEKEGLEFELLDFCGLTAAQVTELIELCQKKLDDFKQKRILEVCFNHGTRHQYRNVPLWKAREFVRATDPAQY
jgi:ATP adenylyltransferase